MYDQPDTPTAGFMGNEPRQVRRDGLCRLDRSDQIRSGKVLLLARARDFLPAELRVDGSAVAARGTTVCESYWIADMLNRHTNQNESGATAACQPWHRERCLSQLARSERSERTD